jgi:glycosyltransferase involved in cell wall biosynthesis
MLTPKKYFIVSGTYNAEKFVGKCIDSVNEQITDGFEIVHVVVDDGSVDGTAEIIKQHAGPRQVILTHHKNMGPIQSQLDGFSFAQSNGSDYDVIAQLDGDDWFSRVDAVKIVHDTYIKTACGATYGNYKATAKIASCCRIPDWTDLRKDLKNSGWPFSHLRTFRVGYTKHLVDTDLREEEGEYYVSAYDAVLYLPIAEMAGRDRVQYIDKELVIYNMHNPIRDGVIRYFDQIRCASEIYSKTPYRQVNI